MAYLLAVLMILVLGILFAVLYIALAYSSLSGSPFVPSSQKELFEILKDARLKPSSTFLDLGCGDGRVVITAAEKYKVKGIGIDINPLLIFFARFQARRKKLKDVHFYKESIFDTSLKDIDVIFLFLMPKLLAKLVPKLTKKAKKGTQIISHGFPLADLKDKLTHERSSKPFPTFYYKL